MCEDVCGEEVRKLVLGACSVEPEDGLVVVELVNEYIAVCFGLVKNLLYELFAKGGRTDGGSQDSDALGKLDGGPVLVF